MDWTEGVLEPRTVMAVLSVLSMRQLSQYPAAVDELIYKPVWPVC